ncbi:SpaA isopeptide-forming pilin-related protein [Bifidobacterium sp. ESL0775]|uniref:isopeptide-forming domain-containing fimbrial protein n=1 Tax=Bifidobacterium sp. ESL0775 TaxID=2983230 RepID=UPI0023F84421|nr:SpaA isopeptide-forming pilin-related protein [Bifidobacterium sp. ESL0775]WEV69438.1 SpaA isopeptide-forming pilin-related protein [Bifidobacterium sp. ESL0775]
MAIRKGLRNVAAAALSAAMILACGVAGVDSANADENVDVSHRVGQIKVDEAAEGHVFKAIRIGSYTSATKTGTMVTEIDVSTVSAPAAVVNAIGNAYRRVSRRPSVPSTAYCHSDTMCWISRNWLGYLSEAESEDTTSNSHPFTGKLREFVTELQKDSGFQAAINTSVRASVAPGSSTASFDNLDQGIYVIEDTTAVLPNGVSNSIPMLVGTTVGDSHLQVVSNPVTPMLGEIKVKSDTPTVDKELDSVTDAAGWPVVGDPSDGDVMHFILTSMEPMTTGFSRYFFQITDKASAGLQYVNGSAHATVDGSDVPLAPVPPTPPSPMVDEVYFAQSDISGSHYLTFTFPNITAYSSTAALQVEYDMKVVGTGIISNDAGVKWSSDSSHQPEPTCVANPATNCGAVEKNDTASSYSFSSYYMMLESTDGMNQSLPLGGATYELLKDDKPLSFRQLGEGYYVYHPSEDKESHTTTKLVTSSHTQVVQGARAASFIEPRTQQAVDRDQGLGSLKIDGLPLGIYTVKETAPPTGKPDAELLKFDVKYTKDASNNGTYVSLLRDYTGGLVQRPIGTRDHLGANFSLNVAKKRGGLLGVFGALGTGMFGPGTLARTGASIVVLLILLCCLIAIGTAILSRRHQISR